MMRSPLLIDSEMSPVSRSIIAAHDTEPGKQPYTIYHNVIWYRMFALAVFLLVFCALLAGLTLAICGLDPTWLHLRCVTGTAKERKRASIVGRMRRHGTWMLCSLIISSVACGETFPIVVQGLWHGHQPWAPILISTLSIGFFAEILPQFIIPRHALAWGYYCWPIIAACMFLTGIVSYPLALVLDFAFRRYKEIQPGLTGDQLAILIKSNDRSENVGGKLGQDACRVMMGALNLDGRRIDRIMPDASEPTHDRENQDVEKAGHTVIHGLIVKWYAVKTIDINERVDQEFIDKIRNWSYSRIPVIGKSDERPAQFDTWEGTKIFGFLHIKNLMGISIRAKQEDGSALLVKDLPLYPLPIVRGNMSVYELLDMFQLGMSRMAVVVPHNVDTGTNPASVYYSKNTIAEPIEGDLPRWTARLQAKLISSKGRSHDSGDRTMDFLEAAKANIEDRGHKTLGVRCPNPIGIVTFEDVIDTILQKTSRDEKDYFDCGTELPLTKIKKPGDYASRHISHLKSASNQTVLKSPVEKEQDHVENMPASKLSKSIRHSIFPGVVRRRNVSKNEKIPAVDGANDDHSSYTQNSRGGFHDTRSGTSLDIGVLLSEGNITDLQSCSSSDVPGNPYSHLTIGSSSLPSRKNRQSLPTGSTSPRNVSAPRTSNTIRRVTPFSRHNYSSYEKILGTEGQKADLIMPTLPLINTSDLTEDINMCFSGVASVINADRRISTDRVLDDRQGNRVSSGKTVSVTSSWGGGEKKGSHKDYSTLRSRASSQGERLFPTSGEENRGFESTKVYGGFPPELLDTEYNKENRVANYMSSTLPRMPQLSDTLARENSFHDDRALLPSQRRGALNSSNANNDAGRSFSLWF